MSGRQRLGGASTSPSAYGADTHAELPLLPARSLRPDPLSDIDRCRPGGRFVVTLFSLLFLVPMICIGMMLKFQ